MQNQPLWAKILAFSLDDSNADFPFSQRLARDNKWTKAYADRVVLEYKKFLYLCSISEESITPSDAVDQAWHLHLVYTRSYWQDLCRDTLCKDIHHNPTKGGPAEKDRYAHCYDATFARYTEEFQQEPPADIWLDNHTRFREINFKRINLNEYWLIRKPGKLLVERLGVILMMLLFSGLFINAEGSGTNLYFLIAFVVFMAMAVISNNKKGGGGSGGGCSSGDYDSGCSGCSGCGGCGGD